MLRRKMAAERWEVYLYAVLVVEFVLSKQRSACAMQNWLTPFLHRQFSRTVSFLAPSVFFFECVSASIRWLSGRAMCALHNGGRIVVLSVGLPSGDPLGVSEGYKQSQHTLRRTRTCTKTKDIYRENSLKHRPNSKLVDVGLTYLLVYVTPHLRTEPVFKLGHSLQTGLLGLTPFF